ncbi:hypothetical protein NP233_g11698 [Leucocoprinus birnbaumii]|uniref:Uncharacterized protein n=1 Tax=Leucocoprinus birnbaumii TaxID=56174 RepID=A0AAD5YK53_9AGAR|nr:hypothetical protein NP233_g11698 [Leucocoprinus birnbaumii]
MTDRDTLPCESDDDSFGLSDGEHDRSKSLGRSSALASILGKVDFSWKLPTIPSGKDARPSHFHQAIDSAIEHINTLSDAIKLLLLENDELHNKVPENMMASDAAEHGIRLRGDYMYPPDFRKYCSTIRLAARKFGFMYQLYIPLDAIPMEYVKPQDRVDPEDPSRYSNPKFATQAITSELYESIPSILHPVMSSFPGEFSSVFSSTLNEHRRILLRKVQDKAQSIFPILAKHSQLTLKERRQHPVFRAALYGSASENVTRIKYPPPLFPNWDRRKLKFIFMAPEIPIVMRLILFSKMSLAGEKKAPSRPTNGQLWKVTQVSPGSIAFASVFIIYLFSGDSQFRAVGPDSGIPYGQLFDKYKEILLGRLRKGKKGIFQWYNERVFKGQSLRTDNDAEWISDVDDAIDADDLDEDELEPCSSNDIGTREDVQPTVISVNVNGAELYASIPPFSFEHNVPPTKKKGKGKRSATQPETTTAGTRRSQRNKKR